MTSTLYCFPGLFLRSAMYKSTMSRINLQPSSVGSVVVKSTKQRLKRRRTNSFTAISASPMRFQIWWSNAILFTAFHLVGILAWSHWPSSWRTWFLCYANWQFATLGITIGRQLLRVALIVGYHRLWSHRSFTAKAPLRIVLAAFGTLGFQGSIRLQPPSSPLTVDGGF